MSQVRAPQVNQEQILAGLLVADLEQQLELRFQPLLAVNQPPALAVEALLRWCHPALGWVPPTQFVQIAEQYMLMRRLTIWVIEQSFRCLQAWRQTHLDVQLSLNISAHDLQSNYLVQTLTSASQTYQIEPTSITLEVTETLPVQSRALAQSCVLQLLRLGFKVALDDFGSGYANMQQLTMLPVNRIKLDRSLIQYSPDSVRQQHVLRSLVRMAHDMGIDVVAEGVETSREYHVLKECGCDYLQGFFIAMALSEEELQQWWQR